MSSFEDWTEYSTKCPRCDGKDSLEIFSERFDTVGNCLECGWSFFTMHKQLSLAQVNRLRKDTDPEMPLLEALREPNDSYFNFIERGVGYGMGCEE